MFDLDNDGFWTLFNNGMVYPELEHQAQDFPYKALYRNLGGASSSDRPGRPGVAEPDPGAFAIR